MKKMALFVAMIVFGVSLMLWAGWHNLRERRLAMQRAAMGRHHVYDDAGRGRAAGWRRWTVPTGSDGCGRA